MKAKIKKVEFIKEMQTQFGVLYSFKVSYDDKVAFYNSKSKDQKNFVEGQEVEFVEEEKTYAKKDGTQGTYLTIKLPPKTRQSAFGKALTKEQSKYSGFADSYIKDLLVNKVLRVEEKEEDEVYNDLVMITLKKRGLEIFEHMVSLDKTLEQ